MRAAESQAYLKLSRRGIQSVGNGSEPIEVAADRC